MICGEAANTNCIMFGLTQSRIELTINRNIVEYDNHYITDAVTFLTRHMLSHINLKRKNYADSNIITVLTRTIFKKKIHDEAQILYSSANSISLK